MRSFVINLDRIPERWEYSRAEFAKAGIAAERFPGVEAKRLENYDGVRYVPQAGSRWEMQIGHIAVFESHRRVWQKIVDDDLHMAAVFEDDMYLLPEIAELYDRLENEPPFFDVLKMDTAYFPVRLSAPERTLGRWEIRSILTIATSAGGYVVTRQGAQRLLEWSDPYCDNIDDFIFAPRPGWRARQTDPAVGIQLSLLPHDFANAYANNKQTVFESARLANPAINNTVKKGSIGHRTRNEIKRSLRKLYWRFLGDRALLKNGGVISACPIPPGRLELPS